MRSASDIADEAINKIEQDDAGGKPADDQKPAPKDDKPADKGDDKDKKDDKVDEKPKYDKDGNRIEDKPAADDKKDDDEGEFTADDVADDEGEGDKPDDKPADSPAPAQRVDGVQLNEAERKYIVDNIGEPMVIRGEQDGKAVEIKVFTPEQIPRNFTFASDADRMTAQAGFDRLERRAADLLGTFRQDQSQAQVQDFEKRENEGIKYDVAELQKSGDFPKFKVQPGQPGFDDDPAAQLMTDVLKVMTDRNTQYLAEYNQGRPYKHIGFAEAYDIYRKNNPASDRKAEQDQEDKERKDISKRTGPESRGLVQDSIVKPRVRSGMTVDQILAAHENDF